MTACKHCGLNPPKRGRGLCRSCHRDPEIRNLYRRKYRIVRCKAEPPVPDDGRPGSVTKIRLITERLESGQPLFHPGDYQPCP